MLLNVLGKGALPGEGHAAKLAAVGLITRVAPHVTDEGVLLVEGHWAERARKRPITRVDAHVPSQVPLVRKALVTVRTLVRPDVDVDDACIWHQNAWLVRNTCGAPTSSQWHASRWVSRHFWPGGTFCNSCISGAQFCSSQEKQGMRARTGCSWKHVTSENKQ